MAVSRSRRGHSSRPAPAPHLLVAIALAALVPAACGGDRGEDGGAAAPEAAAEEPAGGAARAPSSGDPETEIHRVHFRVLEDAVLEIRSLRGRLERTGDGPPYFDEPASFRIVIARAEVALTEASLAGLINGHVLAYEEAPIRDVEIELTADGRIRQRGNLTKAADVPFTIEARMEVTTEGEIRLIPESIQAAGLPVTGLMDLFDIEMAEVIEAEEARGLRIVGNEILLDPERMLPPPAIRGRVESVVIEGERLVLHLGPPAGERTVAPGLAPPDADAPHWMFFHGGTLRFGKLTMHGADLMIVDADPDDPFEFYLQDYQEQLVAGHSRTLPDAGLLVVMADHPDAAGGR